MRPWLLPLAFCLWPFARSLSLGYHRNPSHQHPQRAVVGAGAIEVALAEGRAANRDHHPARRWNQLGRNREAVAVPARLGYQTADLATADADAHLRRRRAGRPAVVDL